MGRNDDWYPFPRSANDIVAIQHEAGRTALKHIESIICQWIDNTIGDRYALFAITDIMQDLERENMPIASRLKEDGR